jgi:uncharacterized protein YgbK (DUF1537 family)
LSSSGHVPAFAFYGDDFTGASAHLDAFRMAGLRTLLYLRTPDEAQLARHLASLDAIGIAGVARSLPPDEMEAEVRPALELFRRLGCRAVQYKACSTFDSAPNLGSIGRMMELGRAIFGPLPMPVVVACPDAGRWTVFGQQFAEAKGEAVRLDRHPTMAHHPATPMDEADLRLHLARQTDLPLSLIDWRRLRAGPAALRAGWDALANAAAAGVIFDALEEADLDRAAALIWELSAQAPVFAVAAQGLAGALGRHAVAQGAAGFRMPEASVAPVDRLLVLSGSASPRSAAQIRAAEAAGWKAIRLDMTELMDRPAEAATVLEARLAEALQSAPGAVAYTALGPDDPAIPVARQAAACRGIAPEELVRRTGDLFGTLVTRLTGRLGLRRAVLAGGDTSSRAMRAIDAYALHILGFNRTAGARISSLVSENPRMDGLQLLLKAGQMGAEDVFLRVRDLEGWA